MTGPRYRHQDGFSLIEVIVAALVLVLGSTALAGVLIGAGNQATAAVTASQLINVADSQIELVRADVTALGFSALAMTAVPAAATLPASAQLPGPFADADRWVTQGTVGATTSAACFQIQANYDSGTTAAPPVGFIPWSNCQSAGAEPVVVLTTAPYTQGPVVSVASQGSGTWTANSWPPPACGTLPSVIVISPCTKRLSAGVQAVVYTFVTYTDPACSATNSGQGHCPALTGGTVTGCPIGAFPTTTSASTSCGDSRRVTVAILPLETHSLARETPVYISSVFTNPTPSTGQPSAIGLQVQ